MWKGIIGAGLILLGALCLWGIMFLFVFGWVLGPLFIIFGIIYIVYALKGMPVPAAIKWSSAILVAIILLLGLYATVHYYSPKPEKLPAKVQY